MPVGRPRRGGKSDADTGAPSSLKLMADGPRQGSLLDQMAPDSLPLKSPVGPAAARRTPARAASPDAQSEGREDHRHGHRERLRGRLRAGGADAMPDYELLEMVLFRAIPRQDTKALAKDLLARFGNLAEVIAAPDVQLDDIEGVGERVKDELKLMRAMLHRLARRQIRDRQLLKSWDTVIAYLETVQAHEHKEAFRILFLDKRNQLIADEVQQRGTVDHTPVYVREVVARALELGATAIILVHNHPSGDPSPSTADIDMTKSIMAAGKPLGVVVHDHIIVGRKGHVSLRGRGLM